METIIPEENFVPVHFVYLQAAFYLLLLIFLLFCSAVISGAEIAYFSLDQKMLKKQQKHHFSKISSILKILNHPKKLLATILVSLNFINIAIVLLTSSLLSKFGKFPHFQIFGINFSLKFITEVFGISFFLLLFGEIIPKIYASKHSMRFAASVSAPLELLNWLLSPFSALMIHTFTFIERYLGAPRKHFSVDQLSQALEISSKGQKNSKDREFLEGIVHFGSIEARQAMTPRVDMFALNYDTPFIEVVQQVIAEGYSRIPVYRERIDDIEGILFAKDLLPFINEPHYRWTNLLHAPFFVPENKKIDNLLTEFKSRRVHLAIVVDEYGGTCGLITLEDVIEEIVGEIADEYDDDQAYHFKLDTNTFIFEGKTPLIDFYRIMEIKEEDRFEKRKGEADTLGGFVMEIHRSFPRRHQKIRFLNYTFIVEALDKKRLKRIKVIKGVKNKANESV
ncbi:gliding motility-associated protein GldE [Bacteroidetes bacterium endosymbiont of Geopemphigus sp.]|uniref:gliding motility-associated protein GldE n=1 Tax=Bacteroidetes bacterium endosymbiont of Geopemphigus sp. TaxID=2047937 RepID=UPI002AD52158|nr:gliding motility-associated protein GldE [Bacteroidetes bacterium endosymbiont of Geopemphigus sp.]